MRVKQITETNRRARHALFHVQRKNLRQALACHFSAPGSSCLDSIELEHLQPIGIEGKRIAQLCCNSGRELISFMNLGAASAVGFDISEGVLEDARRLATLAGVSCSFVRCDVYDVPDEYNCA